MTQSVITPESQPLMVEKLERILDRKLAPVEEALVEYVLEQVRLGLVEVK